MSLDLAWPWVLAALPFPLAAYYLLPRAQQRPASALRIPFFGALAAAESGPVGSRLLRALLGGLAWVLLVTAAARPQLIGNPIALPMEGRDLMLAVDISGSMVEQDMVIGNRVVERLTAVKAVAGDFIERREGDRIGLILFGSQAYLQTPLTFDRETARALLFESAVGLAGRETAIGDAIGLAVKRLRDHAAENRILILLTDGANTAGSIAPMKAAEPRSRGGGAHLHHRRRRRVPRGLWTGLGRREDRRAHAPGYRQGDRRALLPGPRRRRTPGHLRPAGRAGARGIGREDLPPGAGASSSGLSLRPCF